MDTRTSLLHCLIAVREHLLFLVVCYISLRATIPYLFSFDLELSVEKNDEQINPVLAKRK